MAGSAAPSWTFSSRGARGRADLAPNGVDVISGHGLAEALEGVDTIVDAATGLTPDQQAATEFFSTAARNLLAAAGEPG